MSLGPNVLETKKWKFFVDKKTESVFLLDAKG